MLERYDGYHKPEGLPLHLWCMQSLSMVISTPLTERSMVPLVHRSWFMSTLHAVDRALEDGRRGLSAEQNAAELLHERFRGAAPVLVGYTERPWTVYTCICGARGSALARTLPQNPDMLYQLPSWCLVMLYVVCVSVVKNTLLTCVRDPHGVIGPATSAGSGSATIGHHATPKTPI